MKIKDINKENYKLHLIKTNKFKTILVKVVFWNELKKEELTLRNMLIKNLLFSSAQYNTLRKMAIKKDELFSVDLYSRTYRRGGQILSEINLSSLSEEYLEKDGLQESLKFLFEIINNPNVKDGKFEEESFQINHDKLKSAIQNEKEDPMYYSYTKFKEMIDKNQKYGPSILGTLEDLEKITPENLYKYYKKFLTNNQVDIYIVGNFNEDKVTKIIEKEAKFKSINLKKVKINKGYKKNYSIKEEQSKFNQSKIILGGSIDKLTSHEKLYAGIVYNIILGNSPTSKLFKNVREKKSFAYNISSSINRLDGLFFIYAGISLKNEQQAKQEIYKQMNRMKEGKFTNQEIKNAKQVILSIIKEVDEYPGSILDHYMNYLYFENEKLSKQKEEINKVTKEDVVRVANKINIDTVYLLKEQSNEKN